MKGRGIQAAELQIDWPELMRFKRSFTEPVTKRREDDFAKAGIAAFHGRARFAGPTTVQIGEETRRVPFASFRLILGLEKTGFADFRFPKQRSADGARFRGLCAVGFPPYLPGKSVVNACSQYLLRHRGTYRRWLIAFD
jgi:hypothetical protein